jgi:alginate O-acetyltransferase complex protein AlgI
MNFNSIEYLLFIPLVFFCLYLSGARFRWLVLLGASCYFYLTLKHLYLLMALFWVTAASYACGILLERCGSSRKKTALFWGGVTANLLALVGIKYLPFLERNLNALLGAFAPHLKVPEGRTLVSIGVSYFVFQALSYLIDIYLEIEKPERHFGYFALYLAFFPKLLQGPIERAGDLLPQLRSGAKFDQENFRAGLLQFGWGLFKKAVVADRLALYVNTVYGDVHAYTGLPLVIATYLYAFQLYYDFSGYTDMALGTARMFNIRLTQNFNAPYLARSVADFWRRWHISFSRWILDYIFKPLQMEFRNWRNLGTAAALLITFLVSGIWHGASWCFVIWGGLHGLYLAASVFYKPFQKKIYKRLGLGKTWVQQVWQTLMTFHMVCFAWIFFRAASVSDALYVVRHLFDGVSGVGTLLGSQESSDLVIITASMLIIWLVCLAKEHLGVGRDFFAAPPFLRWAVYLCLAAGILFFNMDSNAGFIYFNF